MNAIEMVERNSISRCIATIQLDGYDAICKMHSSNDITMSEHFIIHYIRDAHPLYYA